MAWNVSTVFSAVTVSGRRRRPIDPSATHPLRLPQDPTLYRAWPTPESVDAQTRLASRGELSALRGVRAMWARTQNRAVVRGARIAAASSARAE